MKKKYLIPSLLFVALIGLGVLAKTASTDLFTVTGQGASWGKDIFRITSALGLSLSNSSGTDIFTVSTLGNVQNANNVTAGAATAPSATFYPGIKVPFYNAGVAVVQGSVIIASGSINSTGYGSTAAVLATTTVMGVSDGAYAANAIGYMTIKGYALVLTTGTVMVGNILVSTHPGGAAGLPGYAGATTGTQVVGTKIGKALQAGTAAGGLTLAIIE